MGQAIVIEPQDVKTGIAFDIQRFAVHDGPGIRTLVFLKGCPLRCRWCSNPESQTINPQLMYYPDKCIGCGSCLSVCMNKAIELRDDEIHFDENNCNNCLKCTEVCPSRAREKCGELFTIGQIVKEVCKDKAFYRKSGGGVTITGGEALFQPKFSAGILKACKKEYIHTALETTGYGSWEDIHAILKSTDLVLYDIKHMDSRIHKQVTGVDNKLILKNILKIDAAGIALIVRLPLIPGINDSIENLVKTAEFIKKIKNATEVHILPYHNLGMYKYGLLGRSYSLDKLEKPDKIESERVKLMLEKYGFTVKIGG